MAAFKRGDLVTVVGEREVGVVLGVENGLPRVRWSTDDWSGLYWPHDLCRAEVK